MRSGKVRQAMAFTEIEVKAGKPSPPNGVSTHGGNGRSKDRYLHAEKTRISAGSALFSGRRRRR